MNICMIATPTVIHDPFGGYEILTHNTARFLAERGHKMVVLTTESPDGSDHKEVDNIHFHFIKGFRCDKVNFGYNSENYFGFAEALTETLERLNSEYAFDIIQARGRMAYYFSKYKIARRIRVPYVVFTHSLPCQLLVTNRLSYRSPAKGFLDNFKSNLKSILQYARFYYDIERHVKHADGFISVSHLNQGLARLLYRMDNTRISTVYDGIDHRLFKPGLETGLYRKRYGIDGFDKVILFAGKLTKFKGPVLLLNAVKKIVSDFPRIKLVFCGDGDSRSELERAARRNGLEGHVIFTGNIPHEEMPYFFNMERDL